MGVELQVCPSGARSSRVHEAALRATRELLDEGGLPAATIDGIAARSGVSKATIYKHWPSRIAVAAEAFGRKVAEASPPPDTGTLTGDIGELLRRSSEFYASQAGLVFAQLLAACVTDPGGRRYFGEFFLAGRRAAIAEVWVRATVRGEVDPQVDVETATDIVFGPLVFRLMSGHLELTEAEADKIAATALRGLLVRDSLELC